VIKQALQSAQRQAERSRCAVGDGPEIRAATQRGALKNARLGLETTTRCARTARSAAMSLRRFIGRRATLASSPPGEARTSQPRLGASSLTERDQEKLARHLGHRRRKERFSFLPTPREGLARRSRPVPSPCSGRTHRGPLRTRPHRMRFEQGSTSLPSWGSISRQRQRR
jgi:hypothetical protein